MRTGQGLPSPRSMRVVAGEGATLDSTASSAGVGPSAATLPSPAVIAPFAAEKTASSASSLFGMTRRVRMGSPRVRMSRSSRVRATVGMVLSTARTGSAPQAPACRLVARSSTRDILEMAVSVVSRKTKPRGSPPQHAGIMSLREILSRSGWAKITRSARPAALRMRRAQATASPDGSVATMRATRPFASPARRSASLRSSRHVAASCSDQLWKPQFRRSRPGARSARIEAASSTTPPPAQQASIRTGSVGVGRSAVEPAATLPSAATLPLAGTLPSADAAVSSSRIASLVLVSAAEQISCQLPWAQASAA